MFVVIRSRYVGQADRFSPDNIVQGVLRAKALLGQMRFRADQRDRPGKPGFAQGEGRTRSGFTCADNERSPTKGEVGAHVRQLGRVNSCLRIEPYSRV